MPPVVARNGLLGTAAREQPLYFAPAAGSQWSPPPVFFVGAHSPSHLRRAVGNALLGVSRTIVYSVH